jgi:hypothetical protein
MKNSSDLIGNRIRDLPACSTVPEPTAPPLHRVPHTISSTRKYDGRANLCGVKTLLPFHLEWQQYRLYVSTKFTSCIKRTIVEYQLSTWQKNEFIFACIFRL